MSAFLKVERQAEVAIISFLPALDDGFNTVRQINEALDELLAEGVVNFAVDLTAVKWAGSAMLRVLCAGMGAARKAGGDLVIARDPSSKLSGILKATEIDKAIQIHDTVEGAVTALESRS